MKNSSMRLTDCSCHCVAFARERERRRAESMFTLVSYCNPSASGRPAVVLVVHVGPEAQGVPDELHVADNFEGLVSGCIVLKRLKFSAKFRSFSAVSAPIFASKYACTAFFKIYQIT